jgi:hypothetical protein
MHPSKNRVLVADLQPWKNTQQLITIKSYLILAVAWIAGSIISYGLKKPPVMLRKEATPLSGVVLHKGFRSLPSRQLLLKVNDCYNYRSNITAL